MPGLHMDCRVIPLSDYRFLTVQGPDAAKFLQGQLTCDLQAIEGGASHLGAHCTHQGRMVSSFRIARSSDDSYTLRVHAGIAERALAQLGKYIVFSKAKVRLDDSLAGLALLGADAAAWLQQQAGLAAPPYPDSALRAAGGVVIHGHGAALECWLPVAQAQPLQQAATAQRYLADAGAWQAYLVGQGVGEVRTETIEVFIPQLINLHLTGGISFTKGCYTGQEIVARMKYRGKLKRHMYRAQAQTGRAVAPNTPLFADGHAQSVGEVVLAAGGELLVSVTKDAKDAAAVHLGTADGPPLAFLPLPYDPEAEG